jgi:site-specific DNA-methyltransferase (adenine-specific)
MDLRQYKTILADPPWLYQNWSEAKNGAAKHHYNCMRNGDIASLPIAQVGGDNCALLLWITLPKLVEAAHVPVMKAWNFRPVTCAFVWNKTNRKGEPYTGLGFYTRSGAEACILGIRGKYPRRPEATKVMQVITAPRIHRHSQKPEEQYQRIESLFEGPYIELFARNKRQGWHAWGAEVDNDISLEVAHDR